MNNPIEEKLQIEINQLEINLLCRMLQNLIEIEILNVHLYLHHIASKKDKKRLLK
jgi:hypothetical protein